ncbi:unnamed protein product [Symbiodinium pilosum]|uniref:25S rRNA (uridine-N(3))-methyltransferase BMT5-like domain-containing protein n=1 Tax=Symbiodinium pilosum TaxID=2952 RepID=A0A812NL88_SYMPI|nr:unnamed protein product [Symbiodinium pilosum]
MTAAVKKKAQTKFRNRKVKFDETVQRVVYVGALDLAPASRPLRCGAQVKMKLYSDSKGVGGEEVEVTAEPPEVPVDADAPEATAPEEDSEDRDRRPRYMRSFETKVAEEERQVLEGCHEGEVVRRAKTYAWVRPLEPAKFPEEARMKLQEMCEGFRKKAEDGGHGKPFCGGIEEDVVYVANPDLVSKGTILSVGMKVSFKLYIDNKGVGGYDVHASEEHIEKMLEAIRKNFETEEGRAKSLQLRDAFGEGPDSFKDVLWVGECTHSFSLAAGRLAGVIPFAEETQHPFSLNKAWCSTELRWPRTLEKKLELDLVENLKLLRSKGVWCADEVNGVKLQQTLEKAKCPHNSFDTIFWMMPYVPDRQWRPPASISTMMYYYIQAFLESAAHVCTENGQLVVVVTSAQCLSWNLYNCKPKWQDRELQPEVWWFDVAPFEKHGYQSRFGDGRDRYVDYPVFHRLCDTVAVCWKMNSSAPPEGAEVEVRGVSEDDIAARKKLLEEVGKDPS